MKLFFLNCQTSKLRHHQTSKLRHKRGSNSASCYYTLFTTLVSTLTLVQHLQKYCGGTSGFSPLSFFPALEWCPSGAHTGNQYSLRSLPGTETVGLRAPSAGLQATPSWDVPEGQVPPRRTWTSSRSGLMWMGVRALN